MDVTAGVSGAEPAPVDRSSMTAVHDLAVRTGATPSSFDIFNLSRIKDDPPMNADRPDTRRMFAAGACAGLLALLVAAAPAVAQGGGQQQGQMSQMQQLRQQLRQIDQQLQKIRQQALQDSALQTRQLELQETIGSAARQEDPEYKKKEDRLNEIQKKMRQAQQNQDTAQMRSLMMEGQKLQRDVSQTQQQVAQRDSIDAEIQAFREQMQQKMVEIDPEAEELLERRDSLVQEFREAQGGMQQGGGGDDGGGGQ